MVQGTLLPNSAEVKLLSLRPKAGAIEMHCAPAEVMQSARLQQKFNSTES
jgi:hypothetical protein